MLSFAYLAYSGDKITVLQNPNPEAAILGYINASMPKIAPISSPNDTWEVVWGPAVYTMPGALYQENMMFVVQNQIDKTQFAIAIRGTNCDLDWLMEDLDILVQMNWPPGSATTSSSSGSAPIPTGPMISESTSIDLQILLSMQSNSNTLLQFLKTQTSTAINLCVTGHSLGGALAGTLGLYLTENVSQWDASGKSNVSCITFAAPTAGNSAFAQLTQSTFNTGTYPPNWDSSLGSCFDAVQANTDIAPLCWVGTNIVTVTGSGTSATYSSPLFNIYGSNLGESQMSFTTKYAWTTYVLPDVLPLIATPLTTLGYTQIQNPSNAPLQGSYNPNLYATPSDLSIQTFLLDFIAQATYQHGSSYPNILGVPELLTVITNSSASS